MDTWLKIADAPSSAGVLQRTGRRVSARLIEARSEERPPRGRIVPLRDSRCGAFSAY